MDIIPTPPKGEPGKGAARNVGEGLKVLLVEDEPDSRALLAEVLRGAGCLVSTAEDGAAAAALLPDWSFDVAILDVRLPGVDGLSLLRRIRNRRPETAVVLVTGYASVSGAVAALKAGAYDYVVKPFDCEEFTLRVIGHAAERSALRRQLRGAGPGPALVGRSPGMLRLLRQIESMAESDAPVLITGESGTGKEVAARMLHARSRRRDQPFVAVNCAALPESLIESELFGHERGAFTGANRKRDGRFLAADGGTFLLDEVGEMPPAVQAKLLRVLQEQKFEPLGSDKSVRVDVRILAATHRDLKDLVARGRFREDLYYRLNVLDLSIPPLRERRGDLLPLVRHILQRLTGPVGEPPEIAPRAWAALERHPFPGNVRELEHALERALVLSRGRRIDLEHLPPEVARAADEPPPASDELQPLAASVRDFERSQILRALARSGGRRGEAAKLLGISRKSLWEKLRGSVVPGSAAQAALPPEASSDVSSEAVGARTSRPQSPGGSRSPRPARGSGGSRPRRTASRGRPARRPPRRRNRRGPVPGP